MLRQSEHDVRSWSDARNLAVALAATAAAACSGSVAAPVEPPAPTEAAVPSEPSTGSTRPLTFTYDKPIVGAEVRVNATDLPSGKTVELQWETVTGGFRRHPDIAGEVCRECRWPSRRAVHDS